MAKDQKEGILETGFKLLVPVFIEIGDIVKIDTRTMTYVERSRTRQR
jgi:elongation factor P